MPNDPFTTIKLRLLAVLDYQPGMIVPALTNHVVSVSEWILPRMLDVEILSTANVVLDLSDMANKYGRPDIALDLRAVADLLRAELSEPNKSDELRIGINFRSGSITGNCLGCNADEVADALTMIVAELQMSTVTPDFVGYAGDRTHVEFATGDDHAG